MTEGRFGEKFYGNAYVLIVLTMIFWGGNTVAGRLAVGEISPVSLTSFRWIVAGSVMVMFSRKDLREAWPTFKQRPAYMIAMATFGFTVYNALFYWSAHMTTAVNIAIISGSMPALILLGSSAVYREKMRVRQVFGMVLGLAGVLLVAIRGDYHRLLTFSFNRGDVLILVACVLFAGYSIGLRRRSPGPSLVFFAAMAPIAGLSSLFLLGAEIGAGSFELPTMHGWLVLAYVAIFPSLLAQIFFVRAIELIGPSRASFYANLMPIFGAGLAVALLGEDFRTYHAVALALVLAGIAIAEYRARQ